MPLTTAASSNEADEILWSRVGEDSPSRLLRLACLFVGLAVLALFVDVPVFRFCSAGGIPGDLRRLLTWSELFAHGIGVGLLAITMFVLDPPRRRWIPHVVAAALGAGLVADLAKLIVARFRPHHFPVHGQSVWDSFAGWLPSVWPVAEFSRFDHRLQSFPSAHTAVATGLAIGLSGVYPRGRYLFAVFATLAAVQRIESGAHFVSDTLGGAAIGCLVAAALLALRDLGTRERPTVTDHDIVLRSKCKVQSAK